jgi:hypothetical protein
MPLLTCLDCHDFYSDLCAACPKCGLISPTRGHASATRSEASPSNLDSAASLPMCNSCGSDQLRRFKVIHEAGTSVLTGTVKALVAVSDSDGIGFGATGGVMTGTNTSLLASRCAPPQRKDAEGPLVWWITLAVFGGCAVGNNASHFSPLLLLPILPPLAIGISFYRNRKAWNANELPVLQRAWQESYLCLRCGEATRVDNRRRAISA